MSDSSCDRVIWVVNHMGIRGGDENRSTSTHDAHHFCQHPFRLLKMLKKPLGSCDIKRPLGEGVREHTYRLGETPLAATPWIFCVSQK